jgi:chemotaxis protein MotA
MDIATVIGLVLGMGLVLGSILIGGGGISGLLAFVDIPSVMITIGGSCAAILVNFPLKNVFSVVGVVKNCFLHKLPTPVAVIEQFKEFAMIVRKDGILALENNMHDISDPFLRRGMEMVVGGNAREDIQNVLDIEVSYIEQRHQNGKKLLEAMGAAAPAFGMIGTLIGLVQMLRTLDDPSKIGGGMAIALLTTLYGALAANLVCLPLAGKLETRNNDEMMVRDLMTAGLVSLVDGQTPRALEERLVAYIAPNTRPVAKEAA